MTPSEYLLLEQKRIELDKGYYLTPRKGGYPDKNVKRNHEEVGNGYRSRTFVCGVPLCA